MVKRTHLGEVMETVCDQCGSHYRLTEVQLRQAYGKVRCGECGAVFNALLRLKNYDGELPPGYLEEQHRAEAEAPARPKSGPASRDDSSRELSLHEAMYGSEGRSAFALGPLGWMIGILLLIAAGIVQTVYYQRYRLVENPRYQQQVVNLCRILPCAEGDFASSEQIRMLERNVFTHPVNGDGLMITGAFSNMAPFAQKLPRLLISLFDVQGKLIANRLFIPSEYLLEDRGRQVFDPGATIRFRLEIVDPGTEALTYEFEFY